MTSGVHKDNLNPYAATRVADPLPVPRNRVRSISLAIGSAICLVVFAGFTLALIRSRADADRTAGFLFLGNVPVLLTVVVLFARNMSIAVWGVLTAIAIQGIIMAIMLGWQIGDLEPVVYINSIIITPMLLLAFGGWYITRKRTEATRVN